MATIRLKKAYKKQKLYVKKRPPWNGNINTDFFGYFDITRPPKPNFAIAYPLTDSVIDSFREAVIAIDERKDALALSKKRKKNQSNYEIARTRICLTLIANRWAPTRDVAINISRGYTNQASVPKSIVLELDTKRNYVKDVLTRETFYNTGLSEDYLIYKYIERYMINGVVSSFDEASIKFYQDVISYWNDKKMNWDDVYNKYVNVKSKPNNVRFITRFCNDKGYSRSTAQRFLIIFNNANCFTSNDLILITNGKCNLLSILGKIQVLTNK